MMTKPPYIRAPHPNTGIRPEPEAIQRILNKGWVAQTKIHGHRCQLHVPADTAEEIVAYNRKGVRHKKLLSPEIEREVFRLFRPKKNWNVIDAEWLKPQEKLFVFDFLKKEGELLSHLAFPERWKLLPREYLSPHFKTLPLIKDLPGCLKILSSQDPHVEGLVFKSLTRKGFADTSVVRCRRAGSPHAH